MSEAAKLFNQSGGAANGGKQDVINGAAQVRCQVFLEVDPEASELTRFVSDQTSSSRHTDDDEAFDSEQDVGHVWNRRGCGR